MILSFARIGLVVLLLLQTVWITPAVAQESADPQCTADIHYLMDREQRLYRSVLFGQQASADLPVGSTRTDVDFHIWMKTADNTWRSLAEGFEQTTWRDALMDQRADVPPRRGLLEQRRAPTSDLLPPLLQSLRALQCRLRAVCALHTTAPAPDADPAAPITVTTDGCMELTFAPLESCALRSLPQIGFGTCHDAVASILERESRLLHLVVAYDGAYRSVLQFGGGFEGFLADVRLPLLQPLWQALRVLGSLDNLPCFLAQCDE